MSDDSAPPDRPDDAEPVEERLFDRLRGSGVGVNDPNIVGDAGPFDIPPGRDPVPAPDEVGPAGLPRLPPEDEDTAQP
jgi:hypothetical protein